MLSVIIVIYCILIISALYYNFFKAINYVRPVMVMDRLIQCFKKSPQQALMKEKILITISEHAAKQYLDPTLTEPATKITLDVLLKELEISVNTYKLAMVDQETFHELRRKEIFKYAAEALKYHKVHTVALMAGYGGTTGPRSFTEMFKKIYNITPSELKRKHNPLNSCSI